MSSPAKILLYGVKILLAAAFFVLLLVKTDLVFPYVAGKAIFFRTIVGLAFVFYLVLICDKPEYRPNFKNPLVLAVTVFAVSMIASAFAGVDLIKSLWGDIERSEGVFQYLHYYIYFLMAISVLKTRRDFERMMQVFLAVAGLIVIYGWFQYYGVRGFTLTGERIIRIYSTLGNAIYLAAVMIFAIFFDIYFLVKKYKDFGKTRRFFYVFLLILFTITFFQASSRGAAFGMALSALTAVFLLIVLLPREYRKYKFAALILLILSAAAVAGLSYFKDDIALIKNNDLIYRLLDFRTIANIAATPRFWSWQSAVYGFLEKPVLGWGAENYAAVFNKYFDIRHYAGYGSETWFDRSHNMALDVMVSQGAVGFLSYLAILAAAVVLILKMIKSRPEKKFLGIWMITLLAAYFGQNMLVFDTLNTYILFYFFLGFIYVESQPVFAPAGAKTQEAKKLVKGRDRPILPIFSLLLFVWLIIAWWSNYLCYKSNRTLGFMFQSMSVNFDAAVGFYKEAVKINSPFTLIDVQRRSILPFLDVFSKGKTDKAKSRLALELLINEGEKGLRRHPLDSQLYWILGEAYNRVGAEYNNPQMILRAEEILKEALKLNPRRPEYILSLAQNYMIRGNFAGAAEAVNRLANLAAAVSIPHLLLAKIYMASGDMNSAVAETDKAVALSHHTNYFSTAPGDINVIISIYRNVKSYDKILKVCDDILKIDPKNTAYLLESAKAYSDLGQKDRAKEIAEYILRLNPNSKSQVEQFINGL